MKFELKGHTALVCESQPTTAGFLKSFDDLYPEIKSKNIIISLLDFQSLDLFFFDRLIKISKVHQKAKRSFVIVSLKSIPDSIDEDLICVPTHKEAYDLIEIEEMQRDLGIK